MYFNKSFQVMMINPLNLTKKFLSLILFKYVEMNEILIKMIEIYAPLSTSGQSRK